MKTLAVILKEKRLAQALKVKEVAARAKIDQALISKIEKGERLPSERQLAALAEVYALDYQELRAAWLAEKVVNLVRYEPYAAEVLALAESRVEYLRGEKALDTPKLADDLREKIKEIDALQAEWTLRKPLNHTQLERIREFFKVEYTYESNRIEGNTLTLQETSLVVNEGLTISGKSMREHLEAINHAEAVDFILDLAGRQVDLSQRTLLELHGLILKSIDRENAGRYRRVPVRIAGSRHEPPQPYLLEKMMEDYFLFYHQQKGSLHPVILAADAHERLVSIHPFIDGNGRTARLVMNLILLRDGYTIANLKGDRFSRLRYYQALETVQVDNEPEHFYHIVADAELASLRAHLALT
jgi:Fic family protein